MTAIVLRLAIVREMIDAGSPAYDELETLEVDLQETLNELRRLAHGIYPASLAELGLVGALTAAARGDRRRSRSRTTASAGSRRRSSRRSTTAASRRCRTRPSTRGPDPRVSIRLSVAGGELRFEVRDDGLGFDPAATSGGVGLRNIHDRLEALDGRMEVVSAPGSGTVVSGAVPV